MANIPADIRILPQGAGSGQDHLPPRRHNPRCRNLCVPEPHPAAVGKTHRYQFTVHALDVEHLEVNENASGAMIGFNVHFHTLGSTSLTITYR